MNNNKGGRQTKRPAPLKTMKEEVRQLRPPVIIHTYSPTIHKVDVAQFSALVQSLTGRHGQKRKPDASPKVVDFPGADDFPCASPSSSGDSGLVGSVFEGQLGLISPRGHLGTFEHIYNPGKEATFAPSAYGSVQPTNVFTTVLAKAASTASGPQYSPLFSSAFPNSFSHLFSPLPSPNILSPNFLADLPVLSPSTHQGFDAIMSSSGYGRFPGPGIPSPGTNNAFKDMTLLMSRD